MNKPDLGLTTHAHFIRVVDGDTVEVEVRRRFKVRIKDLLCEEKNLPQGQAAKEFAKNLLKPETVLTLHVPHADNEKLMAITTFDRIVGILWLPTGEAYGDIIVSNGYGRYLTEGEKGHEGI